MGGDLGCRTDGFSLGLGGNALFSVWNAKTGFLHRVDSDGETTENFTDAYNSTIDPETRQRMREEQLAQLSNGGLANMINQAMGGASIGSSTYPTRPDQRQPTSSVAYCGGCGQPKESTPFCTACGH